MTEIFLLFSKVVSMHAQRVELITVQVEGKDEKTRTILENRLQQPQIRLTFFLLFIGHV